jgi:hypothetical protein
MEIVTGMEKMIHSSFFTDIAEIHQIAHNAATPPLSGVNVFS